MTSHAVTSEPVPQKETPTLAKEKVKRVVDWTRRAMSLKKKNQAHHFL